MPTKDAAVNFGPRYWNDQMPYVRLIIFIVALTHSGTVFVSATVPTIKIHVTRVHSKLALEAVKEGMANADI